jgi:hypothetical protein
MEARMRASAAHKLVVAAHIHCGAVGVNGRVEEIIPDEAPDPIALLRLDTDWYESTLHELNHLYDRLSPGGILIIDDYR